MGGSDDPETGDTTSSSVDNDDEKDEIFCDYQMKTLTIIAFILTLLIVSAPAHVKKHRQKILDAKMAEAMNVYEAKKKSLYDTYDALTGKIHGEKAKIEEEMAKMKKSYAVEVSSKQNIITVLQAEIKRSKEDLERVKFLMSDDDKYLEKWCGECFTSIGCVSCGSRVDYLVSRYKNEVNAAKKAVMTENLTCMKK